MCHLLKFAAAAVVFPAALFVIAQAMTGVIIALGGR
jgi:hypothetical protein